MSAKRRNNNPANRVLRVLLIVLLVLVLIAGGLFIFIQVKLGAINRVFSTDYGDESTDITEIEAVDWGEAGVATSVDGVVNVLLVGQDTRTGERERSDTMIILSINKNTQQITMVSLMRDLYVQIPGYSNNRLNAAYQYGGFELLDATIEENFAIVIDYNVEVDFEGFEDIIETLGGIDVELTEAEAEYINGKMDQDTLTEGVNHLTGEEALWYVRTRKVGNSDFERTERQRRVLEIIYEDLMDASWLKLLKVYDSVADNITTDMTNTQIISIAYSAYTMDLSEMNSYRIPADGTYYNAILGAGMEVLIPNDWDETRALLWDYLYSDPEEETEAETDED
ncbi:MAG: LCP family protein [Clostridiales bacterium]|nr:LCP family protein [Clostridiales bacterium]